MKKAIALLLALTVAISLSSIAFAATDIPGTYQAPAVYHDSEVYVIPETGSPQSFNAVGIAPNLVQLPTATAGSTQTYDVAANEMFLVSGGKLVGTDTELRPDETYEYDIYYNAGAKIENKDAATIIASTRLIRKSDLGDNGSIRIRTVKGGSAVQSSKIVSVGNRGTDLSYRLQIQTRANYGTSTTDLEYLLRVVNGPANMTFAESSHTFVVGFGEYSDSTDIGEEGSVIISNDNPVITKDQLAEIAKSANYRNVIFEAEDGNWTFKGRIAGMKSTNFSYNYDPDTDLLIKFPEQEFKFLNFPGGVNFPTTGEMRINVSDVSGDFGTMHAYLYRDGRLTAIDSTYDTNSDEIVFRTNYLGKFVITDMPITDTSIIGEEPDEDFDDEEEEYYPGENNHNPGTGAGTANAMALLGLVSIASAAVVSKKRR